MSLFAFLIKNLNCLHAGSGSQKLVAAAKLAMIPAAGLSLTESFAGWYIDNKVFMSLVLFSILIDMLLGIWVHLAIKHDFNFKKLATGFFGKTMIVILGYVIFEMIHQIVEDVEIVATYFKITLQLVVILYPAGSAMGNMSLISGGKFPPIGWLKRFERFSTEGDIDILKAKKNEKNTSSDGCGDGGGVLPNP